MGYSSGGVSVLEESVVVAPTGVAATDSAALQAAVDAAVAAGGKKLILQEGTYALGTTSITLGGDDVTIEGMGRGVTIITYTGTDAAFKNSDGTVIRRRCGMRELTINLSGVGARALEVENFYQGVWENLVLDGSGVACTPLKLIGANTKSTYYNRFINVDCYGNTACCDVGDACNGNIFLGGVYGGTGKAIRCVPTTTSVGTCKWHLVSIETSGAIIIDFNGASASISGMELLNCRIEPGGTADITFGSGVSECSVIGGSWDNNVTYTRGSVTNVFDVPQQGLLKRRAGTYLRPTSTVVESCPRTQAGGDLAVLTSGFLFMWAVEFQEGDIVTDVTFRSGGTPAGTPLNQWASLWDSARAQLRLTADLTTTAWAANNPQTFTYTSPYRITASGLYYVGLTVVATTPPTLRGVAGQSGVTGIAPILAGASNAGLTNPASAPNPADALVAQSNTPYFYVR